VNGQVNNAEYDFLWKLLANPADNNHSYIFNLQSLVSDYPQSGALHALLMPNGDKRHAKRAAVYFNPVLLHKLATALDSLPKVSNHQIVFSDESGTAQSEIQYNISQAEPFVPPVPTPEAEYAQVIDDDAVAEEAANVADTNDTHAVPPPVPVAEPEPVAEPSLENTPAYIDDAHAQTFHSHEMPPIPVAEPEPVAGVEPTVFHQEPEQQSWSYVEQIDEPVETSTEEHKTDLAKEYEEYMAKTDITPTEPVSSYEEDEVRYFHQPIEDDVYDEIVSIEDIGLEQLAILNKAAQEQVEGDENYFVFEPAISGDAETKSEPVQQQPEPQPQAEPQQYAVASQQVMPPPPDVAYPNPYYKDDVSKYNDEKMPYTFMWWLDKTRKEHAYIYQPYASDNTSKQAANGSAQPQPEQVKRPVVDELQQQYYQSIVANTSLTDYDKTAPIIPNIPPPRKEDKIIERFIQDEPHIKHPTDMKLDNENKAKRSSEDKEELVTETLARVYTEQMLYHKAIITYKKLMLKYPEKSLYFAGQIEQLENKIN
jgi:hypothetical protein